MFYLFIRLYGWPRSQILKRRGSFDPSNPLEIKIIWDVYYPIYGGRARRSAKW